jgi:cyclopropane fatty-acyl-phospholipid synthase-like methyltransferase
MALKIGAGLALNEDEKEILIQVISSWDDNYSSNYDEHDQDELKIIFEGFEPPTTTDVGEIIQEVLSGKELGTSPIELIKPSYIDTTKHFFGAFNNSERECSANWIVLFCREKNKDSWEPFLVSEIQLFYEQSFPEQMFLFNGLNEIYLNKPKYGIEIVEELVTIHDKFVVACYQSAWKA